MRFVVLGGLDVEDDAGRSVVPPGRRPRQLLAVLLCRGGRGVTTDALVDLLWEGDPPASAVKNLQTYVHRLRGRIGAERISYGPDGYALRFGRDECDAAVFESLAEAGRAALAGGEVGAAYARLSEALEAWGGEPYADLAAGGVECPEPVRWEVARLSELQVTAREDHAEAALALGHASGLVPGLTALLGQYPLRERLRGALMLALYRSGRAVEALEVYRTGRALLVDELGVEPGPALRELEQAILTEDPALDRPSPAVAAPAVVPAELPATPNGFTGRGSEVERIAGWLTEDADGGALVAISGGGGIGKSALALHVCDRVLSAFPDGQLYVDLRGDTPGVEPLGGADVLARLLRALGLDDGAIPAESDEAAARFRSVTAGRRLLLVLDNAADSAQVRPLLPGAGGAAVVVTSRPVLTGLDDARSLTLGSMPDDEAVGLLGIYAGPERVDSERDAAAMIARLCGHLPLALRIAGARLVARPDWTLRDLAERLEDTRSRLDELSHDDLAVRTSCQTSHQALLPETARLFELLGLLDLHHLTPPVAAALTDQPVAEARRHLDQLVDAQLVSATGDRHSFHDLIRLYARERAVAQITEEGRAEAIRRVVHHYLATTRRAARALPHAAERRLRIGLPEEQTIQTGVDLPDHSAAISWVRSEADNLVAIAEHASRMPHDGTAVLTGLSAAVGQAFRSQGFLHRDITIARLALESLPDEQSERRAMTHYDLGFALAVVSSQSEEWSKHLHAAVELYDAVGDLAGKATVLQRMGLSNARIGRDAESVALLEQARGLYRHLRDSDREGNVLNNLAVAANIADRQDEALALFQEALPLFDPADDHRRGVTTANIGEVLSATGQPATAVEYLQTGMDLLHRAGLSRPEANAAWHLARALDLLDRPDEAHARRKEALTLYCEIGTLTEEQATHILNSPDPQLPDEAMRTASF